VLRVVVDSNVMVSAMFWAGAPDRVMWLAEEKEIQLVISEDIIKELVEALEYEDVQRKVREKGLQMRRSVEKIMAVAEMINPQERITAVKDDPDDDKFLECAIEGKAEYIVSRDKHLLKLRSYRGINIIKPEELLKRV
jgi:uncharacterized protein